MTLVSRFCHMSNRCVEDVVSLTILFSVSRSDHSRPARAMRTSSFHSRVRIVWARIWARTHCRGLRRHLRGTACTVVGRSRDPGPCPCTRDPGPCNVYNVSNAPNQVCVCVCVCVCVYFCNLSAFGGRRDVFVNVSRSPPSRRRRGPAVFRPRRLEYHTGLSALL